MTEVLENQISNRSFSNAYIISSPSSEKNLAFAEKFAEEVFLTYGIKIKNSYNPDLIEIEPEGGLINIEKVRETVKSFYLSPDNGRVKVYIFQDAQKMREDASNTMLKSLEELSSYNIVIFTTTNLQQILPTIRSRCQIIELNLEKDPTDLDIKKLEEIICRVYEGDLAAFFQRKDFFEEAKEIKEDLLDEMIGFLERAMTFKYGQAPKENPSLSARKMGEADFFDLEAIIAEIIRVRSDFKTNVNYDLSIEHIFFYIYERGKNGSRSLWS